MPSSRIPDEAPSRLEVALTAFVFPGAGQLVQQRWISAIVFLSLGTILVTVLFYFALLPLYRNIEILLEMGGHSSNEPLVTSSIPAILLAMATLLVVHVASIIDAAVAFRRRRARFLHHQAPSP